MTAKRVGIIGLIHESNTFAVTPTTTDLFRRDGMFFGEEIRTEFAGGLHQITGFFDGLAAADMVAVPIFHTSTNPAGTITKQTCEDLIELMFEALAGAGELDGFLVSPHGANAGDGPYYRDLDGFWLTKLRRQVGADVPIICVIDPHANVSERMISACDATIAYRSNPHLDQKERGLEAANLMARTLQGEVRPVQRASFPPFGINIERQGTSLWPCLPLYELANSQLSQPAVLSNSINLGFPYSDVEEMGSSAIVVTDGDAELAQQLADELTTYMLANKDDFIGEFIPVEAAVAQAVATPGPVCLLDMGDNVGGGSAADSTLIAHEIHRRADTTGFVCLYDQAAQDEARAAGVGASLTLAMGGKTDDLHGEPLVAQVTVKSLHDGNFEESEIRHGGYTHFEMGLTAVVVTDTGLTLSLTSLRVVPVSLGVVTSIDLEPADFQILVAKGVHAPVAAYEPVCKTLLRVNTAG
ncbi:MAG: M81 family metallopeptidase, partial [Gemmatimonadetes bacterium]|nr:M81 family metallopeptidase [Gemmatimonadota bacterium]